MRHRPATVAAATALVVGFRVVVRVRGFATASRLALRLAPASAPTGRSCDLAALTATVDAVARRLPIDGRCLARSLALWTLARRAGVAAELRLGVNTDLPAQAHAWVVVDGVALGELIDAATTELPLAGVLPADLVGACR